MTDYTLHTEGDEFDPDAFMERLTGLARRIGKKMVEKLLVAYYVVLDPATPIWAKSPLIGAMVYFGFPVDAVPDVVPVVGFSDDMAVLALALAAVAASVRWRHVRSARETMRTWGFKTDPMPAAADPDGVVREEEAD